MATTVPGRSVLAQDFQAQIDQLKADRVYKRLNHIEGPQGARVRMEGRGEVVILSSNNYLGLANEPAVVEAGVEALARYGAGTASVRFICGTFTVHRELEAAIARFVGAEAALSYVSAWNANEALTATVAEAGDFVISDELNHASIIDSIRLAKAIKKCTTAVYKHADMDDLRAKLAANRGARRKLIWTDGVFSMEGSVAKLPDILEIAREFDAAVVMDDSHATGVLGETGRGTAEHFGVVGEVDVITSTLGKALGGAAGGFIAGPSPLVDMMTQRSRPQLFSNALPPTVAASSLAAVQYAERTRSGCGRCARTRATSARRSSRRVRAAARRDADRADHRRRDGGGDRDERRAARRGGVRDRVRVPGGAAGAGAGAVPDLGGAHPRRPRLRRRRVQARRAAVGLIR
jgi:glycine C-acetyltransferase